MLQAGLKSASCWVWASHQNLSKLVVQVVVTAEEVSPGKRSSINSRRSRMQCSRYTSSKSSSHWYCGTLVTYLSRSVASHCSSLRQRTSRQVRAAWKNHCQIKVVTLRASPHQAHSQAAHHLQSRLCH